MLEDYPIWMKRALQGITYWIGHRRCIYRAYPLAEAALTAEICNLVYANLPDELELQCEIQYSKLLQGKGQPDELTDFARADLVVAKRRKGRKSKPTFIIEIKQSRTATKRIDDDLRRLAAVRHEHTDVRTFMFLIAEAHRPKRFVSEEGKSIRGRHSIPKSKGQCRVRQTWKAVHALSTIERAHYACLLEIYGW